MSTFQTIHYPSLYIRLLLINIVHYSRQHRRLYLPHLSCAVLLTNELVQSPQTSPQCRIKVILNVIVCSICL